MRKELAKGADKKMRKLLKDLDPTKDARMCVGTSFVYDKKGPGQQKVYDKETGKALRKPCEKFAIKGGFVCATHGGSAKQVRQAANERLLSMVDEGVTRMQELMNQDWHLPTAFNATKEILHATKVIVDPKTAEGSSTKPTVIIGINFGKLGEAKQLVLSEGAIQAEVIDGEKT